MRREPTGLPSSAAPLRPNSDGRSQSRPKERGPALRPALNRRAFMGTVGAGLAAAAATEPGKADANGDRPIRFGLIGCGRRGPHDAAGLITHAGAQLVAMADLFEDKIEKFRPT